MGLKISNIHRDQFIQPHHFIDEEREAQRAVHHHRAGCGLKEQAVLSRQEPRSVLMSTQSIEILSLHLLSYAPLFH